MKLTIARFDAVAFRFAVSSIMRSCANKHSERHQRLFSKPLPVPEIPHARFLAGRAREHAGGGGCSVATTAARATARRPSDARRKAATLRS